MVQNSLESSDPITFGNWSLSQAPSACSKSSGSASGILDIGRPEGWRYPSPTGSR